MNLHLAMDADPLELLRSWLGEAEDSEAIPHASAACLATVDTAGRPDGRMVLVHRLTDDGLVFSTDVRSVKARQLASCPEAALVFYWGPLDRQARVRGAVRPGDGETDDFCFEERPRGSRLTAWASPQSQPLADRRELDAAWEGQAERWRGTDAIPRPSTWRSYVLVPRTIELWQAGRYRLHDRILFERRSDGWRAGRLYP